MPIKSFSTNDLSFAAYLMMRGCPLVSAKKLGKSYSFTLDLGSLEVDRLKVEFINSESSKFDAAVRDLKKIMFSEIVER
jgi:hypothetical protein